MEFDLSVALVEEGVYIGFLGNLSCEEEMISAVTHILDDKKIAYSVEELT